LPLEFAVVDCETNGLDRRRDRIIELAIVVIDSNARTLMEWCTLLRPDDGEAGRTDIHGIETPWLAAAPTFRDVCGDIAELLNGRVFCAHNAEFDAEFIDAEFTRAGFEAHGSFRAMCTMELAKAVGLPPSLRGAARQLDVAYDRHTALDDARAAVSLLARMLPVIQPATFVADAVIPDGFYATWGPRAPLVTRTQAEALTTPHDFLSATSIRWPSAPSADGLSRARPEYLAMLGAAATDRYFARSEQHDLLEIAFRHGLDEEQVRGLHHEFVVQHLEQVLMAGRLTKADRTRIENFSVWLGVDVTAWDALVKAARQRVKATRLDYRAQMSGKSVAFTGPGVHPPNVREALAVKSGITYRTTVNSDTDLLVIGSAKVANGQTAKAAELGIPVIAEAEFWQRLGEL
jgi:DNA polymerase-3 subunit epsilon